MSGGTGFRMATGAGLGMPTGGPVGRNNKVPKGYSLGQLDQFTPEQHNLFQQMFGQIGEGSFLSKLAGGDEATFNQMEAPALKQFSGLQGGLASRFSGMGSGARRSSGFQNTSNQAASDFAQQLQANRMGLQQQAIRDLMSFGTDLLNQRPYEQTLQKKSLPFWKQLLLGINERGMDAAGSMAKAAMMGGM
jgi:hypothetical protein